MWNRHNYTHPTSGQWLRGSVFENISPWCFQDTLKIWWPQSPSDSCRRMKLLRSPQLGWVSFLWGPSGFKKRQEGGGLLCRVSLLCWVGWMVPVLCVDLGFPWVAYASSDCQINPRPLKSLSPPLSLQFQMKFVAGTHFQRYCLLAWEMTQMCLLSGFTKARNRWSLKNPWDGSLNPSTTWWKVNIKQPSFCRLVYTTKEKKSVFSLGHLIDNSMVR